MLPLSAVMLLIFLANEHQYNEFYQIKTSAIFTGKE
jgi:hypothetical protein